MVGEHSLHDFGPFKCIEAFCMAEHMVCLGECSMYTHMVNSRILGLIKVRRKHEMSILHNKLIG